MNNENSKDSYIEDDRFSLALSVPQPNKLKFVLDYDYYNFRLEQFLKVIELNKFKEFEAFIDTLVIETSDLSELLQYHEWQ